MKKKSFMEMRRAQLEAEESAKVRKALEEKLPGQQEVEDGVGRVIPRDLATAYYEETNSWMHRFADVRRDDKGFYILHEDNPDAWRMKEGDLVQDVALSQVPYWQVESNEHFREKRVSLKPFGSNPFLTGIGAGLLSTNPHHLCR